MARTATLPILNGESGLSRYLSEIRKFPMLEPQQEYMFAKRWREHDDRDAAHHLVTSHLRLVARWCAASRSSCSRQRLANMYSCWGSSIGNLRISLR